MMGKNAVMAGVMMMLGALTLAAAQEAPPAIEKVEIAKNRAFIVNGKPFFPIFAWLQDAKNFPALKECGMNATAGSLTRTSGVKTVKEYLELVQKAGLYGIVPFEEGMKGHPALLGYIHGDEPDLTHDVSNASVKGAPTLKLNPGTPLWKIVDGVTTSWSILDPLEGATVTITLKDPVTVSSLGVWQTISKGLATAKEVRFEGDGKEILKATLEAKKGRQKFELAQPATFKELKVTVVSATPGENVYGSISEIEGFDKDGKNVLVSQPRKAPRAMPEEVQKEYQAIKAADPTRPVFMTLTAHFMPFFGKEWSDEERQKLYPEYIKATDVVGFDVYPIYGWNKPEWIYLVHDGTKQLVEMAGGKAVYNWIETSKGGQFTGPLERQKEVTPTHIKAEVWMAICAGATGIGYFTHIWKPGYSQFGVPEENRKALREINDQITRLAPAILAGEPQKKVSIGAAGDVKLSAIAREHEGEIYIFAVNFDERLVKSKTTVYVEGLAKGTEVTVVDENRKIVADQDGWFKDDFEPMAVHVYKVKGGK